MQSVILTLVRGKATLIRSVLPPNNNTLQPGKPSASSVMNYYAHQTTFARFCFRSWQVVKEHGVSLTMLLVAHCVKSHE